MHLRNTSIPGVLLLTPFAMSDRRGSFVKTYHHEDFLSHGLETRFVERFYTVSRRRSLRGLHFQVPPHEHTKLVHCLRGQVLDAVVDLRRGSPTYGAFELHTLRGDDPAMLYIPPGLAHGLYALSDEATVLYEVSTTHAPAHDRGIRWDSAGIAWPDREPIVSERDAGLPPLVEFTSPFRYRDAFQSGS
jgi:dTDP-4-dehydrorhamnose 3,5-epimerase